MVLLQTGAPRREAGLWLDHTDQLANPNVHLMKRICSALSPFGSHRICPLRSGALLHSLEWSVPHRQESESRSSH